MMQPIINQDLSTLHQSNKLPWLIFCRRDSNSWVEGRAGAIGESPSDVFQGGARLRRALRSRRMFFGLPSWRSTHRGNKFYNSLFKDSPGRGANLGSSGLRFFLSDLSAPYYTTTFVIISQLPWIYPSVAEWSDAMSEWMNERIKSPLHIRAGLNTSTSYQSP